MAATIVAMPFPHDGRRSPTRCPGAAQSSTCCATFREACGGPVNLLALRSEHGTTLTKAPSWTSGWRRCSGNFSPSGSSRMCPRRTSDADFLRILEAPPGFEPGVFLAFWSTHGHRFTRCLGGNGLELVSRGPGACSSSTDPLWIDARP
jgi:hypothetical protein